jgi:hypothetical protein
LDLWAVHDDLSFYRPERGALLPAALHALSLSEIHGLAKRRKRLQYPGERVGVVEVLNDAVRGAQLLAKWAGVAVSLIVSHRRLQPAKLASKFPYGVTLRKRFAQVMERFDATFELHQVLTIHCREIGGATIVP